MLERTKRKPGLGVYNGTRAEWSAAYRLARVRMRAGEKPNEKGTSLEWKADLIVNYERHEPRYHSPACNLAALKIIREIVAEGVG
jgi:hypothetical protein